MKTELDDALCRDFPSLFRDRHAPMQTTCMCWGFECGDGWEPLIRRLCEQLTFLAGAEGNQPIVSQVKEKYGTLRFYAHHTTDIQEACISQAEQRSAHTCESCGKSAHTRGSGWVYTRCAGCAYQQQLPIEDYEAAELGVTDHVPMPPSGP